MTKKRVVKPKVVNGVHVNFEACKQAFRAAVIKLCVNVPWGKAYTNKRADGIQWKLWCLWRVHGYGWNKTVPKLFQHYFPFSTDKQTGRKIGRRYHFDCARAWTHKSDFGRRQY